MLRRFKIGLVGAGAGVGAGFVFVEYGPGSASVLVLRWPACSLGVLCCE